MTLEQINERLAGDKRVIHRGEARTIERMGHLTVHGKLQWVVWFAGGHRWTPIAELEPGAETIHEKAETIHRGGRREHRPEIPKSLTHSP